MTARCFIVFFRLVMHAFPWIYKDYSIIYTNNTCKNRSKTCREKLVRSVNISQHSITYPSRFWIAVSVDKQHSS